MEGGRDDEADVDHGPIQKSQIPAKRELLPFSQDEEHTETGPEVVEEPRHDYEANLGADISHTSSGYVGSITIVDDGRRTTDINDAPTGLDHVSNGSETPAEPETAMQSIEENEEDPTSLFVPEDVRPTPARNSPKESAPGDALRPQAHALVMSRYMAMKQKLKKTQNAAQRGNETGPSLLKPATEQDAYARNIAGQQKPPEIQRNANIDIELEDEFHRAAKIKFEKSRQYYEHLIQTNGRLGFQAEIKWERLKKEESARKNMLKRSRAKAAETGEGPVDPRSDPQLTFVEEDRAADTREDSCTDESDCRVRKRHRPAAPTKESITMPSPLDAEYESMMVAVDADGDLPQRKLKPPAKETKVTKSSAAATTKASKGRGKGSKVAKTKSAPKSKGGRKTAKEKKELARASGAATTLFTSDIFIDQADEDAPVQPLLQSKNKMKALKSLISSIPEENQKQGKADISKVRAATKDFDGYRSVTVDNNLWKIKGMQTSLKHYQLLGSSFLRRRENADDEPRGGIMADAMGLGKTLMMLANIVNGRPARGERKTTLLVASPNLLTQWASEINTHTDCGLGVMRYGTGNRLSSNMDTKILEQPDIILTTYTEVMHSLPKNDPPIKCQTAEQKIAWWVTQWDKHRGILHRIHFYRVVLDEAQAIKNHKSRTSIACRALTADHRWALSGTPVLNSLTELYSYFKYLRVPHTGSFKIFKNNYCDAKNPESTERLLLRLGQFMLRRTHADVMFGAPILKLPRAHQATYWCDFNPIERSIYDIVRNRFAKCINMWAASDEISKSYSNALVMLLRLRQLTAHVLMLQFVMRDLLEQEDIERIRQVVKHHATDAENGQIIVAVRKQLDVLATTKEESTSESLDDTHGERVIHGDDVDGDKNDDQDGTPPELTDEQGEEQVEETQEVDAKMKRKTHFTSGRSFGKNYDFKPILKDLTSGKSWKKARERARCCNCTKRKKKYWLTECNHIYCESCYDEETENAAEKKDGEAISCAKCGHIFNRAHLCDTDEESEEEKGPTTRSRKRNRVRPERENISIDWLSMNSNGVLPSAKTIAVKAQVLNWKKEMPDVKIIVYTQFLAMIRILQAAFSEEGWKTEQYHGEMSIAARDKAITKFAEDAEVGILLSSLRCGGLGLNLTMASRVIIIDPWWNSAAEQQAFCRVFRIGQAYTTSMTRFCVRNTVDERLIQMQERKQTEIDTVMMDDGSRTKSLSLKDLMRLFGPVAEDSKGKPFIFVDDPEPIGSFHADKDHEGYADEV